MANEQKTKIIVPCTGIAAGNQQVRGLDTGITNKVIDALGGTKKITRASHVEPGSGLNNMALDWLWRYRPGVTLVKDPYHIMPPYDTKWFADLLPVNGPVLGPFDNRAAALTAEEEWLHAKHIPVCLPCREEIAATSPTTELPTAVTYGALPAGHWARGLAIFRMPAWPHLPTRDANTLANLDFTAVSAEIRKIYRKVVAAAVLREQGIDCDVAAIEWKGKDSLMFAAKNVKGDCVRGKLTFVPEQCALIEQQVVSL